MNDLLVERPDGLRGVLSFGRTQNNGEILRYKLITSDLRIMTGAITTPKLWAEWCDPMSECDKVE